MFIILKSERRAVTDVRQQHCEVAMKTDMQMCPMNREHALMYRDMTIKISYSEDVGDRG